MVKHSFDDVKLSITELALGVPSDEPITISFVYKDAKGVKWAVHAAGTRKKVEGVDND
jgi:hypothetical protein